MTKKKVKLILSVKLKVKELNYSINTLDRNINLNASQPEFKISDCNFLSLDKQH